MISNREIIALIPARPGSKSVKDKNIYFVDGKPLLAYSIEVAKKVKSITSIVISTCSKQYRNIAYNYGADAVVDCGEELSLDTSIDIEFITHFLHWYMSREDGNALPELIVHLRPTTPLRSPDLIEVAIHQFKQHPEATALRSVEKMDQSSYKTFEIGDGYLQSVFTHDFELDSMNASRHDFRLTYNANGYVDILRPEFIIANTNEENWKLGKIHGNRVIPFITSAVDEVDTSEDFERLEWKIRREEKPPPVDRPIYKL